MTGLQYSGKRDKERERQREGQCVFSHNITDFLTLLFYFIPNKNLVIVLFNESHNPLSRGTNTIIRSIPFSSIICSK